MSGSVIDRAEIGAHGPRPDRLVGGLRWAIFFVLACIAAVAIYAVTAGVLWPPAPRTQAELVLARSEAAVAGNEKDGQAWAQLARVQYLTGDRAKAYETIARARRSVEASETPILWVNVQELDMVIRDGDNEKALRLAEGFVKTDADFRLKQRAEQMAQGIDQPLEAQTSENQPSIQLFLLKASAETNLKKYAEAVKSYDNVLLMSPRASDVLALRGWAKLNSGDREAAKKDFDEALQFMPDLESAKAGLAAVASAADGTK